MEPGTLRHLLLPTSDTEAILKRILGTNYDPNSTYRVATSRSISRRIQDGWQNSGLTEGAFHLISKPKG